MKKAITILAILIVLVGAVFATDGATETHTIRLLTDVIGEVPAFRLEYTSGALADEASATNKLGTKYNSANTASYGYNVQVDTDYHDVEVADISKNGLNVTFTASILNAAKQVEDYLLVFTAGPFDAKSNGNQHYVNPATATATVNPSLLTDRKGITTEGAPAGVAASTAVGDGHSLKSGFGLHFNGTTCVAGAVGTFNVTYTADPEVDPTDGQNLYIANIKMEVVSK